MTGDRRFPRLWRGARVVYGVMLGVLVVLAGCFESTQDGTRDPLVGPDGEPLGESLVLVEFASGLHRPTFATHAGGGSPGLYVTEQAGRVLWVTPEGVEPEPVLDIRDRVGSGGFEQGLLGLAFAPGFPGDARVFVRYTDTGGDSVVSSFEPGSNPGQPLRLDPSSERVVLRLEQPHANHNGGMIAFSPEGLLYVGFGDGGGARDPLGAGQDPSTWLGSLLRIDVSEPGGYEVPMDNPFVGDPAGAPEVWAYGLRNPWRFSFDRDTGDLWIADVGQNRWEEVNHVPAGAGAGWNFGWNRYEGDERFSDTPAEDPVFPVAVYPIGGRDHCAVTGGYVYRGEAVPALQGVYVFGDWCSGTVGAWNGPPVPKGHRIGSWGSCWRPAGSPRVSPRMRRASCTWWTTAGRFCGSTRKLDIHSHGWWRVGGGCRLALLGSGLSGVKRSGERGSGWRGSG